MSTPQGSSHFWPDIMIRPSIVQPDPVERAEQRRQCLDMMRRLRAWQASARRVIRSDVDDNG